MKLVYVLGLIFNLLKVALILKVVPFSGLYS